MRANSAQRGIIFLIVLLVVQCGSDRKEKAKVAVFGAKLETLTEKTVASVEHTGPYEKMGAALSELSAQLAAEKINATGVPFAVYYNDPSIVSPESLSWAVCIPVAAGTTINPQSGIKIITFPQAIIASTIHTGGYNQIGETYERLIDWIDEQGLMITGPAMEFFISGKDVPVESILIKAGFVVEPAPDSAIDEDGEFEYEQGTEPESING
ncbi:MAG: GyrI-like domain-containing protein [candidate division WOR-3 bacterium]|jgi:effector-binding domain-containing protein